MQMTKNDLLINIKPGSKKQLATYKEKPPAVQASSKLKPYFQVDFALLLERFHTLALCGSIF